MKKRFKLKKNVVLDTQTGLEWQHIARGPMSWQEAMDYAESLGNGWRLPTYHELVSLVNVEKYNPASDFPDMSSCSFWSSSSYASNDGSAWYVSFYNGNVDYGAKDLTLLVRCVRVGPFGDLKAGAKNG